MSPLPSSLPSLETALWARLWLALSLGWACVSLRLSRVLARLGA